MNPKITGIIAFAIAIAGSAWCQAPAEAGQNAPLYRVTVVERTTQAVNYQYRSGPTQIDFRGTALLPEAKGEATVESKAGRTEVDARFERLQSPARFGHEYLTYVLWAITPEGHAKNLGEVLAGASNKARLRVTTDLQAFGLIVTAEPYAAVRQPSDVVVVENHVRSDTIGRIEPIQAKYELMPRGHYTYNVPADLVAAEGNGSRVSMSRYEEIVEVYQAQNAVQIAGAMGAAQYAAETFTRAQELLRTAQNLQASHSGRKQTIAIARESAQAAEDARAIAMKRKQDAEVAEAKAEAARERQRRLQAEADAQTAKAQSSAYRTMLDRERSERRQTEIQAAAVQPPPPPPQPVAAQELPPHTLDRQKRDLRMSLYRQLGESSLQTLDTPRGLVVTIPASDFDGHMLLPMVARRLAQVSAAIAAHPGLSVEVDDNGDDGGSVRGEAVRTVLMQGGLGAGAVSVRSLGNSRPIASNATPGGRELNRRVEVAISGETIGSMPQWDRSYSVVPR